MPVAPTLNLLHELSPGVWTDLAVDLIRDPVEWDRGIFGAGPLDRMAGPGSLRYTLDNTELNSARVAGRYSPHHANLLAGFRRGTRVKVHLDDGDGNARYDWAGRIEVIDPEPGVAGLRATVVECVDWFGEFAEYDVSDLALRQAIRSDQAMNDLVDALPRQPTNRDFDTGPDQYPTVFDDLGASPKAPQVAHDILASGLEYLYTRGDATDGETLKMENRYFQALASVAASFSGSELENRVDVLRVPTGNDLVFNDIYVQNVPRRTDPSTAVLFQADAPIPVEPGDSVPVRFEYRDPTSESQLVGIINGVALDSSDWSANAQDDGGGADLTASFTAVAAFGGSRATVTLTNNGSIKGWVRGASGADGMRGRGQAIRRYRPVTSHGFNQDSIDDHGARQLPSPLVMPYQDDQGVAQSAAQWIANVYANPMAPTLIRLPSEIGDSYLAHGINRDCGDKIALTEDQIGIAAEVGIIRGLRKRIDLDGRLYTEWAMAPADTTNTWIWNTASQFNVHAFAY